MFLSAQGGRASNTGRYSSRTQDATTETSTFSQSRSAGQQSTRADGSTEQNGRGQQRSFVASITSQGGEGSFFSRVSTSFDDGDENTSTRSISRGQSASRSGSAGTSKTDTAGRTTIKGSGEQASRGQSSSTSRTTVYHTNGSSTTVSGRSRGSSSISTQGRVESDHNQTREQGSFTIGNFGSQTVTVTEKGGSSGSSNYGRTTSRTESKSSSSTSGSGSYDRNEDHREEGNAGGQIVINGRSGDGSGGSGNNTNSNNNNGSGNGEGLDTQSKLREKYDNTITRRWTASGNSYEITIGISSHNRANENNGSYSSSVGGKTGTSYAEQAQGYTGGIQRDKSVVVESSNDRTFTSSGSQPGDSQSLSIESSRNYTESKTENYQTTQYFSIGGAAVYPYESVTETTTDSKSTRYNANHNLGKNGEAVGGKLSAKSDSSASFEVAYGGISEENPNGTTYEIVRDATSSGYSQNQTEDGTYGSGKNYTGTAKSTHEYWTKDELETKSHYDDEGASGENTLKETGSNSDTVTMEWNFNANGTNSTVTNQSEDSTKSLTTSRDTFFGETGRDNTKEDDIRLSGSDGSSVSNRYRNWGVVLGEVLPGRDREYDDTTYTESSSPGSGDKNANSGPANPGVITVFSLIGGLAKGVGASAALLKVDPAIQDAQNDLGYVSSAIAYLFTDLSSQVAKNEELNTPNNAAVTNQNILRAGDIGTIAGVR